MKALVLLAGGAVLGYLVGRYACRKGGAVAAFEAFAAEVPRERVEEGLRERLSEAAGIAGEPDALAARRMAPAGGSSCCSG